MTNKICAKIQEGRKTTCNRKTGEDWLVLVFVVVTLLRLVVWECGGSSVGIGQI